jgi:hypothetical protein
MTDWLQGWQDDIDGLAAELPRLHLNLFHNMPEQAFRSQIGLLKADLPDCDDAMVVTRLMAIIAAVGDAHTTLIPPVDHFLPFEFYWFAEGLHIIAARPEYQEWLGSRLIAVENQPIASVTESLTRILAHENPSFVASQLPNYLAAADLLFGLGICDNPDQVQLNLRQPDGTIHDLTVPTVNQRSHKAGSIGLGERTANTLEISRHLELPLYRQHHDRSFWFTPLEPDAVYVQYNACREPSDRPMTAAFSALLDMIQVKQPQKLIIDLRNNLGGDSSLLEPLIDELATLRVKLYAIIGRDTFSSALLNAFALQRRAGAILVGEPSGGKPNCYGEVQYLTLPRSRLRVRYSTKFYHLVEDDALGSLMPDLSCPVTFADYQAGFDPCLQTIVQ